MRKYWNNLSIQKKAALILGIIVGSMWMLIISIEMQISHVARDSQQIMDDYMSVTAFGDAIDGEESNMDAFMRPSGGEIARKNLQDAAEKTDQSYAMLSAFIYSDHLDIRGIIHSIENSMDSYQSQRDILLHAQTTDEMVRSYNDLKRQIVYISSYSRLLLDRVMYYGEQNWVIVRQKNDRNAQMLFVFMMIVTIITVGLISLFINSFLRPLVLLGKASEEVQGGKYDIKLLQVTSNDEIGKTVASFNMMIREVRSTIHAIEAEAVAKKKLMQKQVEYANMQKALNESRFAQLSSQINPHFLFNILNTLASFAEEEHAIVTEDMIFQLSNFFRYVLDNEASIIPLAKELHFVEDYIELQSARYNNRIEMTVDAIPEGIQNVPVPKFVIQPLVENSIVHGLKNQSQGGFIRVSSTEKPDFVQIIVEDNGCGFDVDQFWKVQNRHDYGKHISIGLQNVVERLKYIGGKIQIDSEIGAGTRITLLLPKRIGKMSQTVEYTEL